MAITNSAESALSAVLPFAAGWGISRRALRTTLSLVWMGWRSRMAIGREAQCVALGGRACGWKARVPARAHGGCGRGVMFCEDMVLPREVKTARLYWWGGQKRTVWRSGGGYGVASKGDTLAAKL